MNTVMMASDIVLAQGLNPQAGINLQNLILPIIGAVLVIIIGARALGALVDEKYGKMVSLVAAAVVPALFIFVPDQGIAVLKGLSSLLFGGGA